MTQLQWHDWHLSVGICQIAIEYIVFVPVLLYFCSKIKKIPSNSATFKHRDKRLLYYMNIVSILSLTIEIPLYILASVFHKDKMQYISASFFMWILFILFTIKSWLLFFNLKYHNSLFELQWKKEINARYRSWYILNRNTSGNLTYCLNVTILPFVFYIIIITLLQYLFTADLFIYSSLILWCFVIIPSFILYRKLTAMHHMFNIRKELYYQQTMICTSLTVIVLLAILSDTIVPDIIHIQKLVNTFMESIAVFSVSLISSWFACKTHKQSINPPSTSMDPLSSMSTDDNLSVDAMLECIADRKGFAAFMKHLVQEFATENMLFLCEYIQIKYELQRKYKGLIRVTKQAHFGDNALQNSSYDADKYIIIDFNVINVCTDENASYIYIFRSISRDLCHRMQSTSIRRGRGVYSYLFMANGILWNIVHLPSGLPKAEILNTKESFVERLHALFDKYIIEGTMHEINIPFVQRQKATEVIENMMQSEYKENDGYDEIECNLCNVLDELCIEVIHLMAHSYSRFAIATNLERRKNKSQMMKAINNAKNVEHETLTEQLNADKHLSVTGNEPKLAIIRSGAEYNKLREHYQIDDIEIWPFYI